MENPGALLIYGSIDGLTRSYLVSYKICVYLVLDPNLLGTDAVFSSCFDLCGPQMLALNDFSPVEDEGSFVCPMKC